MLETTGFAPYINPNSHILILGTYPSMRSLEEGFYYMHPRNQFWPMLSKLFSMPVQSIEEKKALCLKHHIALWDVFSDIERTEGNSLDSNLKVLAYNDIPNLLKAYPKLKAIAFTGKKAQKSFQKEFNIPHISYIPLPSPSPAFAAWSFEKKYQIYREKLLFFLQS